MLYNHTAYSGEIPDLNGDYPGMAGVYERPSLPVPRSMSSTLRYNFFDYSKAQIAGHGFRYMASIQLSESSQWHNDAIERQLAHTDGAETGGVVPPGTRF